MEKLGVSLQKNFAQDAPQVYADPLHLSNLISNIIDNGIKYKRLDTPSEIRVITESNGERVSVAIRDNGIGITKEHLEKIFQKFYRVPQGNLHNVKGFGLGLFYVKNICKAHNWDININSDLNTGTTFTILMNTHVQ